MLRVSPAPTRPSLLSIGPVASMTLVQSGPSATGSKKRTVCPTLRGENDPFHRLLKELSSDPDSLGMQVFGAPGVFGVGRLEAQFSVRWAILTKCSCQGLKLEETRASWHDRAAAICSICQVLVTSLEAKNEMGF